MKLFNTYISKKFRTLMFAGVGTNIIMCLIDVIDIPMAGILLGERSTVAVNVGNPVVMAANFLFLIFSIGVPIIYSEKMGEFDKEGAETVFSTGFITSILMVIVTILLGMLFRDTFLGIYNIDEELLLMSRKYITGAIIASALRGPVYYIHSMVLVDGDSVIPMVDSVAGLLARIAAIFILVPMMGITGLNAAAIISHSVSLLVCLKHFFKKSNSLRLVMKFDPRYIPEFARFSLVDAGVYAFSAISSTCINKIAEGNFGTAGLLAASSICFVRELYNGIDGVNLGMEPFINVYRGQKSLKGIENICKLCIFWNIVMGLTLNALIVIFAPVITDFLGVTSPEYTDLIIRGIRIMGFGSVFYSLYLYITSQYLYCGRVALGFAASMFNNLIVMCLCLPVSIYIFGVIGPFISVAFAPLVSSVILSIYIILKYGIRRYPLLLEPFENVRDDRVFQYVLDEKGIISLRDEAETYLKQWDFSSKSINDAMFLIEEMSLFIRDENAMADSGEKKLKGECDIIIEKDIILTLCVDGELMDMADIDRRISSFRSYIISKYTEEKYSDVQNLITIGSSRCRFVITA